ncbi:MAG: helix-turn-helix transcriptional regulator [Blastocatellia bacterium]
MFFGHFTEEEHMNRKAPEDRRICEVIQMLCDQELPPPPGKLQAINRKSAYPKKEKKSIEELAESVNLSESHLHALFKAQTGEPLKHYAKRMKMERALEMIRDTHLKIIEIAEILGFGEVSHFSRDFKKMFERRPSEFRNGNGQE